MLGLIACLLGFLFDFYSFINTLFCGVLFCFLGIAFFTFEIGYAWCSGHDGCLLVHARFVYQKLSDFLCCQKLLKKITAT